MAFKGLRFAGLEWKSVTASKVMWIVVAAIVVIPLLYGALYLAAFQDPYARLDTVPVAVVNEDKGAVIAAENRNLGDDVVSELQSTDNGLQWHFVSADEAQKGLENGDYFMVCTIPANFSKSVASADDDAPQRAQLLVEYNQSENLLASQLGETVWKEVRQRIGDTISSEYWETVLNRVGETGRDLQITALGASTLNDGLTTAHDGSATITNDLGTLSTNANALRSGLDTLSSGALSLSNASAALATGAEQVKSGTSQVASGTSNVSSGAYALQSQGIDPLISGIRALQGASASLPDAQKVQEAESGSQSVSNGIKTLQGAAGNLSNGVSGLQSTAAQLLTGVGVSTDTSSNTLYGGVNQLAAGVGPFTDTSSSTLCGGINQLVSGIGSKDDTFSEGTLYGIANSEREAVNAAYAALSTGDTEAALKALRQAQSFAEFSVFAADSLAQGASRVKTGATSASMGVSSLQEGVEDLSQGIGNPSDTTASTLFGGANLLSTGIGASTDASSTTLFGGLNNLEVGYSSLSSQLLPLVQQAPALRSAIVELDAGASQVNTLATQLSTGAAQVASGAAQVDEGTTSTVTGAAQLNSATYQLVEGAQSAVAGSGELASGAKQLEEGSSTLTTSLIEAVDGSSKLVDSLDESAQVSLSQAKNSRAKSDTMSDPVELVNSFYTTVKNYGTGYAPYFMALGLWVGGLVAGFVLKPLNKRLILSGGNPVMVAFANFMPWAVFALIQATLLMVVLQFGLQLQIDNVPAFYGMGYVTALVFAAIMQMLIAAFGLTGKFVAIILLILQLTACAGTFPIQTTPEFFQAINPFMPMTYVVEGMRQIMAGLDYTVVAFDVSVLVVLGVVCFALTCLIANSKRTVRLEDLHPALQYN